MPKEPSPPNRSRRKEWLTCLDRIAADLNVLLILFAIGWYPNALTQLMTSLGQTGLYK